MFLEEMNFSMAKKYTYSIELLPWIIDGSCRIDTSIIQKGNIYFCSEITLSYYFNIISEYEN